MAVAAFVYATWALRFPRIAEKVPEPLADLYFQEAGDFLDNTDASPVVDVAARLRLLNLLVAHIALINGAGTDDGAAAPVGRLTSASEGSTSVSFDYGAAPGSDAWYNQTQAGAQFLAITAPFRMMTYFPGCQPNFDPWGYQLGFGGQGSGNWG